MSDDMSSVCEIDLSVEGMHCAGCSAKVEGALREIAGVERASVSLMSGSAKVEGTGIDAGALVEAVRKKGFEAEVKSADDRESVAELRTAIERKQHGAARSWGRRLVAGAICWIPLALLHWVGPALGISDMHAYNAPWLWIQFVLATFVMIFVGSAFYRSAWKAAKNRTTNMDTLIAMGATAAYGLSMYVVIMDALFEAGVTTLHVVQPLYFMEAAGLLTLISLGHYLEARTTAAAGSAVRELLGLQPDEVTRLNSVDDESTGQVMLSADIEPGDLMLVRPGERIAVDGEIVRGRTSLDESVVTGEALPVDRGEGDEVIAGSMNLTGKLIVRATTTGRDTTIARIADMVRQAQSSKADIQKLADKVCAIFVPAVLAIALATFVGWAIFGGEGNWFFAIVNATSILVISCPCALGLATPTAVMVGSGVASKRGILVKSAQTLEHAVAIRTVLFDKTGTLTTGKPTVVGIISHDDKWDEASVLEHAGALALGSMHPLAQAVVREVEMRGVKNGGVSTTEVHEEAGRGVAGSIDGKSVSLMSRKIAEEEFGLSPIGDDEYRDCTSSVLTVDGQTVGEVLFRDEVRPEAKELISGLREMGVRAVLVTGDRRDVALALGARVGLDEDGIYYELKPDEKVVAVRKEAEKLAGLSEGGRIAMVGDGINDAAALAQAGASGGVGIAMGAGSNIAIESADVVISGERLTSVLDMMEISRSSLRTIKQNLFFSFIYNSLAIPAAAFGLLGVSGPLIAAGAMGFSDVCVIGNSLRLKWRLEKVLK